MKNYNQAAKSILDELTNLQLTYLRLLRDLGVLPRRYKLSGAHGKLTYHFSAGGDCSGAEGLLTIYSRRRWGYRMELQLTGKDRDYPEWLPFTNWQITWIKTPSAMSKLLMAADLLEKVIGELDLKVLAVKAETETHRKKVEEEIKVLKEGSL